MSKKMQNLRGMSEDELKAKLSSLTLELQDKLKIQIGAQNKNVKKAFNIKKDIARVLTIMKDKQKAVSSK